MYIDFYFSSRRRHTRSKRDWSSDVCSSDLNQAIARINRPNKINGNACTAARTNVRNSSSAGVKSQGERSSTWIRLTTATRSEERRVGKEWRGRRWEEW